jgi:hypothetical protein
MMSKEIRRGKSQPEKKPKNQQVLRTVAYDDGFHFYAAIGKYIGITATSLIEFAEKLQTVSVESVSFHFQRDDFQKWLRNVLDEEELARKLDELKQWPSWSSDEYLQKELVKAVRNRIAELIKNQ